MFWMKKAIYNTLKNIIKIYLMIFCEFRVWGKEKIISGPKIFCSNHFSSTDPFFVITLMSEPVHMIIGPGFSIPILKNILNAGEQINALEIHRSEVINSAVKYLSKGESVYIFPEGNLNNQNELLKFYNGVAKIHIETNLPIIPIGILSPRRNVKDKKINMKIGETVFKTLTVLTGKYYANIGEPLLFQDKDYSLNEITKIVRNKIIDLINDIKINKFWS